MADLKIIISEKDGVEKDNAEYRFNADDMDFSAVGFTATKTRQAIEEVNTRIKGTDTLTCGFSGSASTGRWYEWPSAAPSNTSPYHAPRAKKIRELAVSNATTNATFTVKVFKNVTTTPVEIASISVSAGRSARLNNLNISVAENDLIGVQQTSGSSSKPAFFLSLENV